MVNLQKKNLWNPYTSIFIFPTTVSQNNLHCTSQVLCSDDNHFSTQLMFRTMTKTRLTSLKMHPHWRKSEKLVVGLVTANCCSSVELWETICPHQRKQFKPHILICFLFLIVPCNIGDAGYQQCVLIEATFGFCLLMLKHVFIFPLMFTVKMETLNILFH